MRIGEKINDLRKKNNLSQDQFAELFNVTRQTVSNWENGKSYPDLEMTLKISNRFRISVDELLQNNGTIVRKTDSEKKKKSNLLIPLGILFFAVIVFVFCFYIKYEEKNEISFEMNKSKTYHTQETNRSFLDAGVGYFTLVKDGKVDIKAIGDTDDGELHIVITDDKNKKIYYQIDGGKIEDSQSVYFNSGSYMIQVTADDYTEDIVSLEYHVKVNN